MRQSTLFAPPTSTSLGSNQITIAAYEQHAEEYILKTPVVPLQQQGILGRWISEALTHIPAGGSILEIGSATPRDALFMREQGFKVQCSDATQAFLKNLRHQGEEALYLDVLETPLHLAQYNMVFANAVIQHFTPTEASFILTKIFRALPKSGVLAFTTKQGTGESWITEKFPSERFVHYWGPSSLRHLLTFIGFEIISMQDNVPGEFNEHHWIMVVARKP